MSQPLTITNVGELLEACADEDNGCTSLHLDHSGEFKCGTRATNLDSLEEWATNPQRIVEAAERDTCATRWVIFVRQDGPPNEHDASHHLDIRAALACAGVTLVDTVIAWQDQHVSMHYLEHRSTSYNPSTETRTAA